jgi:hypothetical protein
MDSLSSPFPETFPRAAARPESATPGLSVALYVLGGLCLALGVFLFFTGGLSTAAQAGRTVETGIALTLGGLLLLALGYGLTLLYRIETHLRGRTGGA